MRILINLLPKLPPCSRSSANNHSNPQYLFGINTASYPLPTCSRLWTLQAHWQDLSSKRLFRPLMHLKFLIMHLSLLLCLLFLALINFASATAHGHRHRHSHGSTTNDESNITTHTNETTLNLSFMVSERAKVKHIHRHARKFSDRPRDQLRTEQKGSPENEETQEPAVWMSYITAVLAFGLILGAELAD